MTPNSLPLPAGLRDRLDPRTLGLFAAGAVLVGLIWFVARWASATPYVTLYHDLELKDVATITDRLQKADIEHRLGPSGTEVLVPPEELARARVALAKDGLPSSGRPGLELFDRTSWGMTDFTQRVTYQRALEGELARTIAGLRGVQSAQVHLVLSEHGGFRSSDRPGSASVVVTLPAGTALPDETVRGITYVVSNSVEGLASDDVAVMDDGGHVLSTPADAGTAGGLTSRQLDLQRTVERQLSEKIESMLATVVGQGRARAQVSALLGFDQVDRTEETYDPETQVLQLEQRSERRSLLPVHARVL